MLQSKAACLNDKIEEIELESGESITADKIISTCGGIETEFLLSDFKNEKNNTEPGEFSIIESISVIQETPKKYGWDETVIFFNNSEKFDYKCPDELVDLRSGVICIPEIINHRLRFRILSCGSPIRNFSKWDSPVKR